MKKLAFFGGLAVACAGTTYAGEVDPGLEAILQQAAPNEVVSTLVYLDRQFDAATKTRQLDMANATLAQRHEEVVLDLQLIAMATQGDLVRTLADLKSQNLVSDFHAFWISNVIRVDATPDIIRDIAARNDVYKVYYNYKIELIEPTNALPDPGNADHAQENPMGPEIGLVAIRAPEVWALGIDGTGRLISTLDTGVDGNHPALANRWRGLDGRYAGHPEWAFFDPVTHWTFPRDGGSHGTHTMGTVCGGAPGDQVGVAPGAQWINAAVIDRVSIERTVSDALLAFEWTVDPDGNPSTNWDVPDTSSNSWGLMTSHGYPPCDKTFWNHLDNVEAAGVVVLFSAGNEGFSGLRRPADRATDDYRTCAVAAVDAYNSSWPIASFSSRGPTYCTPNGSAAIKPDIAAPGVNVRSSVPGGGYSQYSGTSMASPHINGVVAMMRQANPNIPVEQVKQIIYDTAYDLGPNGEDNDYGWGMVDAYEAVIAALATNNLTFEFPYGLAEMVDPNGGTAIRVEVVGQSVDPEPGTGMLYYRIDGGAYSSISMVEITPNVYDAVFPALDCLATVEYYFSADTVDGETIFNPFNAPERVYSALVAKGVDVVFEDNFENDKGWRISYSDLSSGRWQRGIPVGGNGAPDTDYDGSGQCWVTELAYGKDVDGGPSRLESPTFGVSDGGVILNFGRWHYSQYGNPDQLNVEVSRNDGSTYVNVGSFSHGTEWAATSINVHDVITPSPTMKMRLVVSDNPDDSRTESGLDAFNVSNVYCDRMGLDVTPLIGGQNATFTVTDATSGNDVYFVYSLTGLGYRYIGSLSVVIDLANPQLAGTAAADGSGTAQLVVAVPNGAKGKTVWLQAVESGRKTSVQSHKVN